MWKSKNLSDYLMKSGFKSLLIFISVSFSCLFGQTGLHVPQLNNFDTAMIGFMSAHNIPGGQLAITKLGRLVYNRGFGIANVATGDSVYPNSRFRIASLSKPVTAVTIMKLYQNGKINLDAKVFGINGILNDIEYQTLLDSRDTLITIRMLLQHRGGWDASVSGDPLFDAYNIATFMGVQSPPGPDVIIRYVLENKMLDFIPGTQTQYSNLGFCILGKVIEKVTSQTYTNYVSDSILAPIEVNGMEPGFNVLPAQLPNEVNYYDHPAASYMYSVYDNTTLVPGPYGGFNIEAMDGLGRWVSSAEDIVKLICSFDRFNTRPDFLTPATIDTMTKPSPINQNVACGFGIDNVSKNWWHYGSLYGSSSALIRFKNAQVNIAMLFNSNDTDGNIYPAMSNLLWNIMPTISSWPVFDLFTDLQDLGSNKEFFVYPNPASSEVVISTSDKMNEVKIVDLCGKEVSVQKYSGFTQNVKIPIANLDEGIYFLKISVGEKKHIEKLVVKHQ